MTWWAAGLVALAVLTALPPRPRTLSRKDVGSSRRGALSLRPIVAFGAGLAVWGFVGGPAGPVVGVAGALGSWLVLARAEPSAVRREREEVAHELPHLVDLFASTLRAGAEPLAGLEAVCRALPGPAADRLAPVVDRGRWGSPSEDVWRSLTREEALAPLARAMIRAEASGASVADVIERLADELESESLAAAEDAARRVGVSAAIPLGVCLLPAFLLIGVAPTVAALLASIAP